MLRPIFGCLGHLFQLLRANLKPLILLVSLGTFIWLIVNTTNRPEFTRHASRQQPEQLEEMKESENRWSEQTVQIFLSMLDIDGNATDLILRSDPCALKDEIVFTAFTADTLEEQLWQYFTLIALRQNLVLSEKGDLLVKPFLPLFSKQNLEFIFEKVPMEVIGDLPFNCYDIANALIVTNSMEIPQPAKANQIYILDNGVRRYQDLVGAKWDQEASILRVASVAYAYKQLAKLRDKVISPRRVEFVGIHIRREDSLPFEYYYRAIAFQRKLHQARLIFVVICEDTQGKLCKRISAPEEEIYVLSEHEKDQVGLGHDFALMTLCNHTIVSNDLGIFHALINGGDVVVYEFSEEINRAQYVPWLIASEKDRWYMLG
ncbi:uncharacterized protein LOC129732774 [Wyeomyia smithii]|uniref:uncharacterized protein LOC129732774 n=1 Tax=Wyeomyia smithii TaxID=174621 RepID=UPI002467EE6C|nr:uncharacterized protein LOC129732774 [Wyeomyia smithii]